MTETEFECFDEERFCERLAGSIPARAEQIRAAVELLNAGNTLPFIARYRKEATKGLDETALRTIEDGLTVERDLAARKATILKSLVRQDQLNDELRSQIEAASDRRTLEHIYLPYKPRRRTRATAARERGLEPLADFLLEQRNSGRSRDAILALYVDPSKDVPDAGAALQGALDIVAEKWSEDADVREWLVGHSRLGRITSRVKRGQREDGRRFEMYFDHSEPLRKVPSHRLLAMKRGEAEGFLKIGVEVDEEFVLRKLRAQLVPQGGFQFAAELREAVADCYRRLLQPATESTLLQELKESADTDAIRVFAKNLRDLLLAPPAGRRVTIGIDPGFRTGCKVAVVGGTGQFLEHATIFPTAPRNDTEGAARTLRDLIDRHQAELIAIGNGTASRETAGFVTDLLRDAKLDVTSVVVSEAGASVYSASEVAASEYPDLDVTVRGAISIAHRLQDPLAELIKLDPASIGVGQYQHDVNQAELRRCLDREVESCVTSVGVDLNTASAPLLAHVAGIGSRLAEKIVAHRDANGAFATRTELQQVPRLGQRAWEQAAGFLRIRSGTHPLDNSAVHPESYHVVDRMASRLGCSPEALVGNASMVGQLQAEEFVDDHTGALTVRDILDELMQPGRDPRKEFRTVQFDEGIHELTDLREGMILEGAVTNVTKFGAFVDVGVHQDGLVHISELDNRFVEDPSDVVSVGDVVKVKVLSVDPDRRRIALSRKQA